MELYILLVSMFGSTKVHNYCEYLFFTPHNTKERVIEVCETNVWYESFPNAYKK